MNTQLEIAWRDEAALREELESHTGKPVHLVVTDNASSVLSVRHEGLGIRLRLHHMFLSSPPAVLQALAEWVRHPKSRRHGRTVDQFIREHAHLIRRKSRPSRIRTQGVRHDLLPIYDGLNDGFFDGRVDAGITWGRRPGGRRRRRSIRFGSYAQEEHIIRIHPVLDQPFVPSYFLRYIVFHEMLHAFLGITESAEGRRRIHPPEFRRFERAYPDFGRAVAWQNQKENLRRLLSWRAA